MAAKEPPARPRVHIVDDDAGVRRALTRLVESMGILAQAYASPRDLLDRSVSDPHDCLLLDVQLPEMDGFELYRRVREAGSPAPVIFISARATREVRARAAAARAVALLEKPFDEELLLAAIRRAVLP